MESGKECSLEEEIEGFHMSFQERGDKDIRSLGFSDVEVKLEINFSECAFDVLENSNPNIGDMIEIRRKKYSHWALSGLSLC